MEFFWGETVIGLFGPEQVEQQLCGIVMHYGRHLAQEVARARQSPLPNFHLDDASSGPSVST